MRTYQRIRDYTLVNFGSTALFSNAPSVSSHLL